MEIGDCMLCMCVYVYLMWVRGERYYGVLADTTGRSRVDGHRIGQGNDKAVLCTGTIRIRLFLHLL